MRSSGGGRWLLLRVLAALAALSIVAVVANQPAQTANAEEAKAFHWKRYDYDIEILRNGDMVFNVTMTFSFDRGSFHQGYYEFDMDRVEAVKDVEVWEEDRQYRPVSGETEYGFEATVDDTFKVLWWFPYSNSGERTFRLKFVVVGGLRIYEGGDQFWWNFYAGDRPARIDRGVITVRLPADFQPEDLRLAVTPDSVTIAQVDPRTIQATVNDFPANTTAVLRAQFPHGFVDTAPPSWQAAEDRRVAYEENWKPLVELGVLGLSLLVLVAGTGGVVALWYLRGRDRPVGVVAEYITEPPSDLPPGVVGALVDERVDVRDVLATIVDLARRGVIEIEEIEESGFLGIGKSRDFCYRRLETEAELLPFEQIVLDELLGHRSERRLSELKNKFYAAIPRIGEEIYKELVERGYFHTNPERTRRKWRGLGVVGLVMSVVGFVCGAGFLAQYASSFFCLPIASAVPFLALIVVGGFMPRKTEKGATEAAQWNAFKRYLQDIERYDNLAEKVEIFERYFPYAIAFGLQKEYIRKFAAVEAPAPRWYRPYPPLVLFPRGGHRDDAGDVVSTSSDVGGGGGVEMPSLQGMSDGMASSLQSMSDGLVSMLNSASRTLTSSPSSSSSGSGWSGGGGGFSGGGGGGGGSGVS